jgi:hypothetical protein
MIKPGDKVICIKDIIYSDNTFYFKNQSYEVTKVTERYIDLKNGEIRIGFYLDIPIEEWRKFSEHFISLAEWREQQINSILEDD